MFQYKPVFHDLAVAWSDVLHCMPHENHTCIVCDVKMARNKTF